MWYKFETQGVSTYSAHKDHALLQTMRQCRQEAAAGSVQILGLSLNLVINAALSQWKGKQSSRKNNIILDRRTVYKTWMRQPGASWNHGHHQMLFFILWCFVRSLLQTPSVAACSPLYLITEQQPLSGSIQEQPLPDRGTTQNKEGGKKNRVWIRWPSG